MTNNSNRTRNKTKGSIQGIAIVILIAMVAMLIVSFLVPEVSSSITFHGTLLVLMVLMSVLFFMIQKFFRSLDTIDGTAKVIAKGDLNVSDILLDKTKGLENLTLAINDMKSNFLSFIELTKGNIVTLSDAINQVSTSIEVNYKGNEQIASNMNTVAERAQQQLMLVNDTITDVENSDSLIKKIIQSITNIEECIEGTVSTAASGSKNLEQFYSQLNTMSDNLDNTNKFMDALNKQIGKISDIGEFIIQVSQQLKLLSLNASIEAAKAGESGKGFAVVSNEIRNLSTQTQESMIKIDEIVNEVMKSSEVVNNSISGFISNFYESKDSFEMIKESFNKISQQSGTINKDMKGIYEEVNLISTFTKETKAKGMELHSASEEISSSTEDVAAVTQELLAGLEGITSQASTLNDMLLNIQGLVKRFNTSVLPVDKIPKKTLRIACISLDFPGNEFWGSIRSGAIYAQKELVKHNSVVDFFGYTGSEGIGLDEYVNLKMKECIDKGYDGIALPGFFPQSIPFVEEASRKKIPVMAFNCDFNQKTSRMALFAPNNLEGGRIAGNLIAKAIDNQGKIILLRGESEVSEKRKVGVLNALKKNKKVKIVDEVIIPEDPIKVNEFMLEYLKTNKSMQGICMVGGGVEGIAKALVKLGLHKTVKLVGFEHTSEIFEFIKDGIIYASVGQDTFGQGHDPLIWLHNCAVTGEKTPDDIMYLRSDVVDSKNVNELLVV